MKKVFLYLLFFMGLQPVYGADSSNMFSVIEILGWDGAKTYQALSQEGYQGLRNAMAVTNRVLPKALALAKQEWKDTKTSTSDVFPSGVAFAVKIRSVEIARKDQAEKKVRELMSKVSSGDGYAKLSGREKQLELVKAQIESLRKNTTLDTHERDVKIKSAEQNRLVLEKDLMERRAKQAERDESLKEAQEIFGRKLAQLTFEAAAASR